MSASGPYATDDNASDESTGSATSLRIRSWTTAVLASGGPSTTRRSRRPTRAPTPSPTLAARLASTSPPSSVAKRPNRPGVSLRGCGATRLGSTGSAAAQSLRSPTAADQCLPTSPSTLSSLVPIRRAAADGVRTIGPSGSVLELTSTWCGHLDDLHRETQG